MSSSRKAKSKGISESEIRDVEDMSSPRTPVIYEVVRRLGEEEMERPLTSLWWSGVAAGLAMATSVLAQAILHDGLAGSPARRPVENLGYSLGFVVVILSRLQLFTENTMTVVLPVLSHPSLEKFWKLARLWAIVLVANLVGAFVTALFALKVGTATPEHNAAMLELSRQFAQTADWQALARGIPAGFYIAAVVWMLPSSKGFEILVIVPLTWLIAAGHFTHVIAGATDIFLLVLNGELGFFAGILHNILPMLGGNIIGGTGLFALLAYAQIKQEM
jgi:formate/nitrite transporter FocA (FNT family)